MSLRRDKDTFVFIKFYLFFIDKYLSVVTQRCIHTGTDVKIKFMGGKIKIAEENRAKIVITRGANIKIVRNLHVILKIYQGQVSPS